MRNYFTTILIAFFVSAIVALLAVSTAGDSPILGASTSRTTVSNPWTFSGAVIQSGTVSHTGANTFTSTITATGITSVAEFTQGGGITTLTDATGGTYTLTEAELLNASVLKFAAGASSQEVIALTLPATSTWTTLLPTAGDMREWIYDASALAAATTTTITKGTGVDLIAVTTNDDLIDGAEFARITCWRQASTDVACITSELVHSD